MYMAEISIGDIIAILTLFIGGGSLGGFFTWRYTRRKEKAEAQQAETSAAKEMQDMYQQMLHDKQEEVEDNKRLIQELRQDRDHYKHDRDQLRQRQDDLEAIVRGLQREVARNGRMVEGLRPFMCSDLKCKKRQRVVISAGEGCDGVPAGEPQDTNDGGGVGKIEPINNSDL